MQAIRTKYLAPTNHKGTRIKATCEAGSITVGWDYEVGPYDNHCRAAQALKRKLADIRDGIALNDVWLSRTVAGQLPDGSYAHVFIGD